jgi:hypothetical protein
MKRSTRNPDPAQADLATITCCSPLYWRAIRASRWAWDVVDAHGGDVDGGFVSQADAQRFIMWSLMQWAAQNPQAVH